MERNRLLQTSYGGWWFNHLSCVQFLCSPINCSPPGLCPWSCPSKNTGVGCHFLFQGIFLTRGSNPGLLHSRPSLVLQADSLLIEPPGKPRDKLYIGGVILQWDWFCHQMDLSQSVNKKCLSPYLTSFVSFFKSWKGTSVN